MILSHPLCPHCGQSAAGVVDTVDALAFFEGDPAKGAVEYSGSTEIAWETQRAVIAESQHLVQCDSGHRWPCTISDKEEPGDKSDPAAPLSVEMYYGYRLGNAHVWDTFHVKIPGDTDENMIAEVAEKAFLERANHWRDVVVEFCGIYHVGGDDL